MTLRATGSAVQGARIEVLSQARGWKLLAPFPAGARGLVEASKAFALARATIEAEHFTGNYDAIAIALWVGPALAAFESVTDEIRKTELERDEPLDVMIEQLLSQHKPST